MKAVTFHGERDVRVDTVPDPSDRAAHGRDRAHHLDRDLRIRPAPVRGDGSVHGRGRHPRPRADGIVEEVGPEVTAIKPGDRVVVPFNISCGSCYMCDQQLYSQCETTQVREQSKGDALFGYTKLYGQVPGGQAEFLRVPQAQFDPINVPEGPSDERFVYLSDVLPTAWQAVEYAAIPDGGTVAVFGLGPIGQMACRIALHHGASEVCSASTSSPSGWRWPGATA